MKLLLSLDANLGCEAYIMIYVSLLAGQLLCHGPDNSCCLGLSRLY